MRKLELTSSGKDKGNSPGVPEKGGGGHSKRVKNHKRKGGKRGVGHMGENPPLLRRG